MIDPFAVKDCALIAIATGERAHNLRELRDRRAIALRQPVQAVSTTISGGGCCAPASMIPSIKTILPFGPIMACAIDFLPRGLPSSIPPNL